jgi:hypothetical protein
MQRTEHEARSTASEAPPRELAPPRAQSNDIAHLTQRTRGQGSQHSKRSAAGENSLHHTHNQTIQPTSHNVPEDKARSTASEAPRARTRPAGVVECEAQRSDETFKTPAGVPSSVKRSGTARLLKRPQGSRPSVKRSGAARLFNRRRRRRSRRRTVSFVR